MFLVLVQGRKFQGTKVPCNFRSREQKFQGAKVPGSESSTYGTFALGSEITWERKFQLPFLHESILQFNVFYPCFLNVLFIKVKKHVFKCFLFAN